jgi:ubiquitin thioesterase protein OTUB1
VFIGKESGEANVFKCLTSAWMQTYPDDFQPFVDQPIGEYCGAHVEPTAPEIEHVGMHALAKMLLNPARIALEILYLDRTPGSVANTYSWEPTDDNGMLLADPPAIRLLYRP